MAKVLSFDIPVSTGASGDALDISTLINVTLQCTGSFSATYTVQGTIDGSNWVSAGQFTTTGILDITDTFELLRIKRSAFTSGSAAIVLAGHRE